MVPEHGLLDQDGDGELPTPAECYVCSEKTGFLLTENRLENLQPTPDESRVLKMNARTPGNAGQGWKGGSGDHGQTLDSCVFSSWRD